MALTFRSGRQAKVLLNTLNASSFFNDATLSADVNLADVTTFQHDDRNFLPTMRAGTLGLAGFFDGTTGAVADTLIPLLQASTTPVLTYGPEDDTVGRRAILLAAHENSLEASSPVDGVVGLDAQFTADGGWRGGFWLKNLAAGSTSTGLTTGTAVDAGANGTTAGSTNGAVAHLHVTADSTAPVGDLTVAVQHSSDASAWADLITFTVSTASTSHVQREAASGTVKRHLRYTQDWGSTVGGAWTYAVAAARNPT